MSIGKNLIVALFRSITLLIAYQTAQAKESFNLAFLLVSLRIQFLPSYQSMYIVIEDRCEFVCFPISVRRERLMCHSQITVFSSTTDRVPR